MAGFKESLKDAVRQLAYRTSLDSLKKKGVQNVSVLGIDRIVGLIEAAVNKSLRTHLVGIEREAVADATKAEFLRLLRSNEDLQRQKSEAERQKERAEDEIDHLRRELQTRRQELQVRLDEGALAVASRYAGENSALAKKVGELFASLAAGGGPVSLPVAEERVMALVMDAVTAERQATEAARAALRDREVENLQRRIAKLTDALGTTEQRLQQVAALKDVDGGISSIYREVQGLSAEAAQSGKKKELMADIFKANLKLQKQKGAS